MAEPMIDTRGIPAATAKVVCDLVEDLITTHPGLSAFQLAGSYWNVSAQLPDADIDLRRFGDVDRDAGDERVRGMIVLFEYRGRLIELAEWVFGDLTRPANVSLRDAVSFVRAHLLWERGSRLRELRAAMAEHLADPVWLRSKVDEAFERCTVRFTALLEANRHAFSLRMPPAAFGEESYFKHVFYTLVDELSGLISVLDLRPPSLARKAMLEIEDCLSVMRLSGWADRIYGALGCDDLDVSEIVAWHKELDALYEATAYVNANGLLKKRYHLAAIAAMLDSGRHRAAVFPLWRGLDECHAASDFIPPPWLQFPPGAEEHGRYRELRRRIRDALERLRVRLGFGSDSEVAHRIEACLAVLLDLRNHRNDVYAHLQERVAAWNSQIGSGVEEWQRGRGDLESVHDG